MCGLIKRDSLEDVDIGFAFLETFRSKGYGYESASAIIEYGVQKARHETNCSNYFYR